MLTRRSMLSVVIILSAGVLLSGTEIRVSPGQDLTEVRDSVRQMGPRQGKMVIVLSPGRYRLSRSLVLGPDDSDVVWRAEKPGTAFICGSHELVATDFSESGNGVLVTDLKGKLGFGRTPPKTESIPPSPVPELFFNGRRMPNAVWPNEGWATIDTIVDSGTAEWTGSLWGVLKGRDMEAVRHPRGGAFTYAGSRPSRWADPSRVLLHGYWAFDWSDTILPVATIDPDSRTIRLAAPHIYGVKMGNPQPRRWRAINLKEEVDLPGEYAVDFTTGNLYFKPPCKFGADDRVTIAIDDFDLVTLAGTRDVAFEGIVFEECYNDAARGSNTVNITFGNCHFRNLRRWAVELENSSRTHFVGCDIHDIGMGGVSIEGGDRRSLKAGENIVEDSRFHHFALLKKTSCPGVRMRGVGNVISHCEFRDCPHQAIAFNESNESVVEYSVISNACLLSDDASAFYMGLNPSARGNVLKYNYWQDIGRPMGHGNCAVYFDDGTMGETVFGNIFVRTGEPGKGSMGAVFSHGGYSNVCANCIFLECKRAIGSAPWNDERWEKYVTSSVIRRKLLEKVCVTNEPYVTKYPDLKRYLDPKSGIPRDNLSMRNAIINCNQAYSGRWMTDGSDVVLQGRVTFDEVAAKVPGFVRIPIEKIGLKTKTGRPEEKSGDRWLLAIGDSITAAGGWQTRAGEILGLKVRSHCKGGIGIRPMVDGDGSGDAPPGYDPNAFGVDHLYRLGRADVEDVDVVVLMGFYNERSNVLDPKRRGGGNDMYPEQQTFCGRLNYAVARVREELAKAGNSRARIFLVTPHRYGKYPWSDRDAYEDGALMVSAIRDVARAANVGFVDVMETAGINRENWNEYQNESVPYSSDYLTSDGMPNIGENRPFAAMDKLPSAMGLKGKRVTVVGESGHFRSDGNAWIRQSSPCPWNADQLHLNSKGYRKLGEAIAHGLITACARESAKK